MISERDKEILAFLDNVHTEYLEDNIVCNQLFMLRSPFQFISIFAVTHILQIKAYSKNIISMKIEI